MFIGEHAEMLFLCTKYNVELSLLAVHKKHTVLCLDEVNCNWPLEDNRNAHGPR